MSKLFEVAYNTSPHQCNLCFSKIEENEIEVGQRKKANSRFPWRHLDLHDTTSSFLEIEPEDVQGFDRLHKKDKENFQQRIRLLRDLAGEPLSENAIDKVNEKFPLSIISKNKREKSKTNASSRGSRGASSKSRSISNKKSRSKSVFANRQGAVTRSMTNLDSEGRVIQRKVIVYAFPSRTQMIRNKTTHKSRSQKPKPKPKSRSQRRKQEKKRSRSKSQKQKSEKTKKEKKTERSKSLQKKSKSKSRSISRSVKKAKKQKKISEGHAPSSSDEKKYQKLIKRYSAYTVAQLKKMLEHNKMSRSGNKEDLAAKIAGAIMYGKILNCTSCGGGRPKLVFQKMMFVCNGFMDDTDYKFCKKHYAIGKVETIPWEDLEKK